MKLLISSELKSSTSKTNASMFICCLREGINQTERLLLYVELFQEPD